MAELRDVMREILELIKQVNEEAPKANKALQEEIRLLNASVALLRRAVGTGDFRTAIGIMQDVIRLAIMVRTQILLLQSTMATTPVGAALLIVGILGTAASGFDMLSGY